MNAAALVGTMASGAAGLTVGAAIGHVLGRRYRNIAWRFWTVNGGAFVVCSALCAVGLALGIRWLAVGALGLLAGVLTGAKYGARGGFLSAGEDST